MRHIQICIQWLPAVLYEGGNECIVMVAGGVTYEYSLNNHIMYTCKPGIATAEWSVSSSTYKLCVFPRSTWIRQKSTYAKR